MYTNICSYKKNYVSFYSHNFYVYPYFKNCSYEKGTMCLFIHIIFMYTHISKFLTTKKELCE